jgi:hypothetical protein
MHLSDYDNGSDACIRGSFMGFAIARGLKG